MADPFVVNLAEALRTPGAQHGLFLQGHLPGIALSNARVPDDAMVTLDATVEALGRTVVVQGTVRAPWEGECRRCLEEASGELSVDLREVFEPDPVDGDGDTYPIENEQIDLGVVLRELLALALPLAPLCRDGCPGADPDDHPIVLEPDDEADRSRHDPRWGALDELRFDS
jgi:uncharacterized protein